MNTDFFVKTVQGVSWKNWLSLLLSTMLVAIANTVLQFFSMAGVGSLGVDMPKLNWKSLGVMCLVSAITHAAAFIKKSPLANVAIGEDNTQTPKP